MRRLSENVTGSLIGSFAEEKQGYGWALYSYSIGLLFGFGMTWWSYQKYVEFNPVFFGIGLVFVYLTYRMATQHKRSFIQVYEKGIWISWDSIFIKSKFFMWEQVEKIEQKRFEYYLSPTVQFLPGYYIKLKEHRGTFVSQTVGGYTDLYRLFNQYKVRNAYKPLYIFDVDVWGFVKKKSAFCSAVYYPDKNKLVNEKIQPIVY